MKTAADWIKELDLLPHPEGGFYRQTDASAVTFERKGSNLPLYTNINFLLTEGNPSHFHKLTSDELWFYHGGDPLFVHTIYSDGRYEKVALGLGEGEKIHHRVPAGAIFGSDVLKGYALVSCTVIPGFDFDDFRLFTQEELMGRYPQHEEIIRKLAYEVLPAIR